MKWILYGPPVSPRAIKLTGRVNHCIGTRKPQVQEVQVEEEADKSIITAYLGPRDVFEENSAKACKGVMVPLAVFKTVKLSRPVLGQSLFDGSVSPPAKRCCSKRTVEALERGG